MREKLTENYVRFYDYSAYHVAIGNLKIKNYICSILKINVQGLLLRLGHQDRNYT